MPGVVVFQTLFLVITIGVQPVSLAVGGTAASVELQLDGETVAMLSGEPWTAEVDFGDAVLPHRLVAVARSAAGAELGRTEQMVNLPRPRLEARLAIEPPADDGTRRARLLWNSVEDKPVESLTFTFDGDLLDPVGENSIRIPRHDSEEQHVLVARVTLQGGESTEAVAVFGGVYGEHVEREITSVAIEVPHGRRLPPAAAMAGWFLAAGREAQVVTVERPPRDLVMVRDREALQILRHRIGNSEGDVELFFTGSSLQLEDRVFYVHPVVEQQKSSRAAVRLFPITIFPVGPSGGSAAAYAAAPPEGEFDLAPIQIADAAAVAGKGAAAGRRRAVVVLGAPRADDASRLDWDTVTAYLRVLRVPIRLWEPGQEAAKVPPELEAQSERVHWPPAYKRAVLELRADLARQRIVWLEGSWLPQEIEFGPNAPQWLSWPE